MSRFLKKNINLIACCTFLFVNQVIAQNPELQKDRANIWYIGNPSTSFALDAPALDFTSGIPVVLNNGRDVGIEGCGTICKSNGDLLFYGINLRLFNKNHDTLQNGSGLTGDNSRSTTQGLLMVPQPESDSLIYVFSTVVLNDSLRYHIVNTNLDGGLGGVTTKNIAIHGKSTEKLAAVHHCNGIDVWIITHEYLTNNFIAYLVTSAGLDTTPVITSIGPVHNWVQGCMKFSPNGKKLAIVSGNEGVPPDYPPNISQLYDFDNETGIISNPINLHSDTSDYGISFSPDNSKLYIATLGTNTAKLKQYDVSITDSVSIEASLIVVWEQQASFGILQNGPDGKIYCARPGFPHSDTLSVINNPNEAGLACNYIDEALYLNGSFSTSGLNNLIESYFNTSENAYPCTNGTPHIENVKRQCATIYPNPMMNRALISFNSNFVHPEKISFRNILGQDVSSCFSVELFADGNGASLYQRILPPGIYFAEFISGSKLFPIKFIITH